MTVKQQQTAEEWIANLKWDGVPRLSAWLDLDALALPFDHPQRQQAREWLAALQFPEPDPFFWQRLAEHVIEYKASERLLAQQQQLISSSKQQKPRLSILQTFYEFLGRPWSAPKWLKKRISILAKAKEF